MISVTDLRPGTKVEMDGSLFECTEYQHQKIGRGGAKVVAKFKNLATGANVEKSFNSTEKLKDISIETREMQYLYPEDDHYILMDLQTYDQTPVPAEVMGEAVKYAKEGMIMVTERYQERILRAAPPTTVELLIVEAPPAVRGDTVSGATKPATLETGAVIQVPLFVEAGETIKIDTRSGEYLSRA